MCGHHQCLRKNITSIKNVQRHFTKCITHLLLLEFYKQPGVRIKTNGTIITMPGIQNSKR